MWHLFCHTIQGIWRSYGTIVRNTLIVNIIGSATPNFPQWYSWEEVFVHTSQDLPNRSKEQV